MSFLLRRAMMRGGVGGGGAATDPYFEQVYSISSFEGGSATSTFMDMAPTLGGGLWGTGSTSVVSTTRFKDGVASYRMNGGQSLSTYGVTSLVGDFTAEAWVYLDSTAGTQVIWKHGDFQAFGYEFYSTAGGILNCYGNSAVIVSTGAGAISAATWTHCAVTRQAGVWRIWVNGVLQATSAVNNLVLTGVMEFGYSISGAIGNVDMWRYTGAVARYTSTFTPPTALPYSSPTPEVPALLRDGNYSGVTFGNLAFSITNTPLRMHVYATDYKSTGKWYGQVVFSSGVSFAQVGVRNTMRGDYTDLNSDIHGLAYRSDGGVWFNGAPITTGLATYTTGDVVGVGFDCDARVVTFYKNGALVYTVASASVPQGPLTMAVGNTSQTAVAGTCNFSATPPSGFTNLTRKSYAEWNPSDKSASVILSGYSAFSNTISTGVANNCPARATLGKSSGKWYWECTGSNNVGVSPSGLAMVDGNYPGVSAGGGVGYNKTGIKYVNGASTAYGATYTASDTIGVALDLDTGTVTFYKNGVSQGAAASGLTGTLYPTVTVYSGADSTCSANFGKYVFKYPIPAGYNPGIY